MQSGPLSSRGGGPDTHDRARRPSGRCRHADEVLKNTSDSRAPTTPPRGGGGRVIGFATISPTTPIRARCRRVDLVCSAIRNEYFLSRAESFSPCVDHGALEISGLTAYAGVSFPPYSSGAGGVKLKEEGLPVGFVHVCSCAPWGVFLRWVSFPEGFVC